MNGHYLQKPCRNGACLQHKDLPIRDCPFDILRCLKVLLNCPTELEQVLDLLCQKHSLLAKLGWDLLLDHTVVSGNGHEQLLGNLHTFHLPAHFVESNHVRTDMPTHNRLAQTEGGVDHHFVLRACHWIAGKEHARGCGCNHLLHNDGHAHRLSCHMLASAVDQRTGGP